MSKKSKKVRAEIYYIISRDIDLEVFQAVEVHCEKCFGPEELKRELYKTDEFSKQEITEVFREHEVPAYALRSKTALEPL